MAKKQKLKEQEDSCAMKELTDLCDKVSTSHSSPSPKTSLKNLILRRCEHKYPVWCNVDGWYCSDCLESLDIKDNGGRYGEETRS